MGKYDTLRNAKKWQDKLEKAKINEEWNVNTLAQTYIMLAKEIVERKSNLSDAEQEKMMFLFDETFKLIPPRLSYDIYYTVYQEEINRLIAINTCDTLPISDEEMQKNNVRIAELLQELPFKYHIESILRTDCPEEEKRAKVQSLIDSYKDIRVLPEKYLDLSVYENIEDLHYCDVNDDTLEQDLEDSIEDLDFGL